LKVFVDALKFRFVSLIIEFWTRNFIWDYWYSQSFCLTLQYYLHRIVKV